MLRSLRLPATAGKPLLPAWLLRMLRPARVPFDWTRTAAAVIGIGLPLVVGTAVGSTDEALLVSLGALCATFADLTTSYRYRIRRVGLTTLLGGLGFALGVGAPGPLWAAAVVIAVAALSVVCSGGGDLWGTAGAQMLTFCVVATGETAGVLPVGEQIGWFLAGECLVVAVVAATWPFRRTAPARAAVARVFEETVRMSEATGEGALAARHDLTGALNRAHDLLIGGATASRSRLHDRLYVVLSRATPVVEAAVALAHAGVRPPDRVLAVLREIARCVRDGDLPREHTPSATGGEAVRALETGIGELITDWRRTKLTDPQVARERMDPRARLRVRLGNASLGRIGWIRVLRMVLCVAAAEGIGLLLGMAQPYWIALTVALVLKPNSGSVFARILLRGLGTVLGVLVAVALLAVLPPGWWLVALAVVAAACVPVTLSRNYGWFTVVVTALVLVKMSQTELYPVELPAIRLVDSLIGCAIAVVFGYLIWPFGDRNALTGRFADAVETVAEYVSQSLSGLPRGRSALRRRTYRQLSDLRATLQQHLMEPAATRREAELWWPTVIVLERVVDGATERAVLIEKADEHRLQHAQRIVSTLRRAARQLRTSADVPPRAVRERLENVYAEVVADYT